jgi:hypothetical protein
VLVLPPGVALLDPPDDLTAEAPPDAGVEVVPPAELGDGAFGSGLHAVSSSRFEMERPAQPTPQQSQDKAIPKR